MLAEAGLSWRVGPRFDVSANIHWLDAGSAAVLLRTDAGYVATDPLAMSLAVSWWH